MATSTTSGTMETKEILSATKVYETQSQQPPPSKDYCHLLVTKKGIVVNTWKITLRNRTQGWYPTPEQTVMSYEDFQCDTSLQEQLSLTFSSACIKHVLNIITNKLDAFSCLPIPLASRIIAYLDLQTITCLSQTNQHFHEVCNSDLLWKKLYINHLGQPNNGVKVVAESKGWKRVFFMTKLELQKEISRQRRNHLPSSKASVESSTFLTQEIED